MTILNKSQIKKDFLAKILQTLSLLSLQNKNLVLMQHKMEMLPTDKGSHWSLRVKATKQEKLLLHETTFRWGWGRNKH